MDSSILKKIVYGKFVQNNKLMVDLLRTYPDYLIEGTKNMRWGRGHDYPNNEYSSGNIPDQNLFGKILVELRDEFRTEYALI